MLVEQCAAGQFVGAGQGAGPFDVGQVDAIGIRLRRSGPDRRIDPRVGAKAKRIEIAGQNVMPAGVCGPAGGQ